MWCYLTESEASLRIFMRKQYLILFQQYLDLEARVNINKIVSEFKRILQFILSRQKEQLNTNDNYYQPLGIMTKCLVVVIGHYKL